MIFKIIKTSLTLLTIAFLSIGVSACVEKGTAEKAGASLDQAVENADDKAAEVGEAVGDAVEKAGEKVESATD